MNAASSSSLNISAIITVGILAMLILVLLLVGALLARFMAVPDKRLASVEASLGTVRADLAGLKASLQRVEGIVNRIVDNALDARGSN